MTVDVLYAVAMCVASFINECSQITC